jgi:DNA polymerase I-like protein with 3'-5' exonuclease and polymerase domains
MKKQNSQNLNIQVGRNATILVVTDIQCDEVFEADMVMSAPEGEVFMREAKSCGFEIEDFLFINPCPPIKAQAELKDLSDAFVNAHLDSHSQEFIEEFTRLLSEKQPGIVVTLGRWSLRQVLGVSTPITKVRGTIQRMEGFNLLPLLSPREVLRFPDRRDIYNTDFLQLEALSQHGWDVEEYRAEAKGNDYEWCLDLQELIENPPTQIAFDTETVGLEHRLPGFRVLTAAITPKKGRSLVVPLDIEWWNNEALMSDKSRSAKRLTPRLRRKLINQLKEILENPHVHVVGHNLKYDIHVMRTLDIEITNWYADTIQLAFLVDENMQSKNLDDCVRRWLPQYAGYADEFNAMTDKSRMQEVKHEPFLLYAGGDTDVCYRLAAVLIREGRKDSRQWDTFVKVQMPALRTFVEMERRGVRIDTDALTSFGVTLAESARELTSKMLEQCPPELLRAWTNAGKKVSFDSPDFLAELLFGEDYGIKVKDGKVVEKGGKPLIPLLKTSGGKVSTSAKDHLPYFEHVELVQDLIQYKKVSKMRSTYVGERGRTEVTEVERLKSGGFPKVVTDALDHFGITLPKIKAGRRRTPYPQIETKLEELGAEALVMHCAGNKGDIVIDAYGKAERHQRIEPSGFWQYIKDPDNPRIFPSFWLHRTVTGRAASCLHADVLIDTYEGKKRIADVIVGDLVWTHMGRWKPVVNTYIKPIQEMFDSALSNGEVLRSTAQHRLFTDQGSWVMLGDVSIKETSLQPANPPKGSSPLSLDAINNAGGSSRGGGISSYSNRNSGGRHTFGGTGKVEGVEVFGVETWGQEPNAWEDASELEGGLRGRSRLSDSGCSTEEALRSQSSDGGNARDCSGTITSEFVGSSYRRESEEQRARQSCAHEQAGSCSNTPTIPVHTGGIRVTRIDACGCYPVYDIEVEDDHSYSACGVFHHNSEPNGQNLPNRGELAKAYRRIFIPSEGFSFAEVDLSQAELRVAACMANEREMIRIYQEGGDIHSATAAAIMGITDTAFKIGSADESPLTDCAQAWPGSANYLKNLSAAKRATVTVSEYLEYKRQCAKAVNFGFLYGMGWRKFKVYARTDYKLNFTDEESMEMRELFFRKYPRLKRWHEAMREFLAEHGFVRALHGALRRLPNVESDDEMIVGMTSRQGINSPVQRFASDLGIIAVTRFMRDANHEDMRALLFIHDANVIEAKSERIDEAASALKYYMENTPLEDWFSLRLPIPFEADVKTGPNLCEMSKRKDITAIKPDWFRSGEYPRELTEGMEERWKALLDYGVIIEG